MRLPPEYVADAVSLEYASTATAAQGRTVDHSLVLVDGPIDPVNVLAEVMHRRWIDASVLDHASVAEIGLE